jgi:8-oxo-dGTP pyrophosphatase MutT (NUDIX family)
MYKVFIHNCVIRIAGKRAKAKKNTHVFKCKDEVPSWREINSLIAKEKINEIDILLQCENVDKCWAAFKKKFRIIRAAGGLVKNQKGEYLMIYRLGHWDLPKGKIEKGEDLVECALREVEEECAVTGLGITGKVVTTYHIHRRNGRKILKMSHWYHMRTDFKGKLKPQREEGIEKVKWVEPEEVKKRLKKSWPSVLEVFKYDRTYDY